MLAGQDDPVLTFTMHGAGWGDLTIAVGGMSIAATDVSYLCYPVSDLLDAALKISFGYPSATVFLLQEPGIYKIEVDWRYHEDATLPEDEGEAGIRRCRRLRIYHDPDSVGVIDTPEVGTLVLAHEWVDPDAFARGVLRMADDILLRYGAAGYRTNWSSDTHAFPSRALAALRAALGTKHEEVEW